MTATDDSVSTRLAITRFVSTLGGAFQSFYLYQQDNKMVEEITQTLLKRFHTISMQGPLTIGISPRSFTFDNEPMGLKEVTIFLAGELYQLGFREMVFRAPLQSRMFFQLLHILVSKEGRDAKIEKLGAFIDDGEEKPLTLIPSLEQLSLLQFPDDVIKKRLNPLALPKEQGGAEPMWMGADPKSGFSLHDLYTWLCVNAQKFPWTLRMTVQHLADAAREGFMPTERFNRLFPFPAELKESVGRLILKMFPSFPARKPTRLGHSFKKKTGRRNPEAMDWLNYLMVFSREEIALRQKFRTECLNHTALQDIDLAQDLLDQDGSAPILGFQLLLNNLADDQPLSVQEKAYSLGMDLWRQCQKDLADPRLVPLISALRQRLSSPAKINLCLFPLRSVPIESEAFAETKDFILSLGEAALPPLIAALAGEQDRSMRRKLCHLITSIGQVRGIGFVVNALKSESPFLQRNLVMILGEIGNAKAIPELVPLLDHPQQIVRSEAVRSLIKIGDNDVLKPLIGVLSKEGEDEAKSSVLDFLLIKKPDGLSQTLIQAARQSGASLAWRRLLYKAMAKLGGSDIRLFFESIQKGGVLNLLNSDSREEQKYIKSLLAEMTS